MATKKNPNTGYKKDQLLERAIKATADKDCVFLLDRNLGYWNMGT